MLRGRFGDCSLACWAGIRRSWGTGLLIWLGRTGNRAELRQWWLQTGRLLGNSGLWTLQLFLITFRFIRARLISRDYSTHDQFCLVLTVERASPEDWLGVSSGCLLMNYSFDTKCILSLRISWYSAWYVFLDALNRNRFNIVVFLNHWWTQAT